MKELKAGGGVFTFRHLQADLAPDQARYDNQDEQLVSRQKQAV